MGGAAIDIGQTAVNIAGAVSDYRHTKNLADVERTYNATQPMTYGLPTNQCINFYSLKVLYCYIPILIIIHDRIFSI